MDVAYAIEQRWHELEQALAVKIVSEAFTKEGINTPCYIFGRNSDSQRLLGELSNVAGIIDDFAVEGGDWFGTPLVRRETVPKNALLVNAVTNSKPRQAQQSLELDGFTQVHYIGMLAHSVSGVSAPKFVTESLKCFQENQGAWQALFDRLDDESSKQVLKDILSYRLSGNPACLGAYNYRPEDQYFEDFLALNNEVFIDGGGCKGETTLLFAEKHPDYKRVDIFEPDERNISAARLSVSRLMNTRFHPIGLSDERGTLYFDSGQGSASSISDKGDVAIDVEALDNIVQDASFIKLDLEGWELPALKGAETNIRTNRPKLAVGAYHNPKDFLEITAWVLDVQPDYKVALRHYTESWTESVLYFY